MNKQTESISADKKLRRCMHGMEVEGERKPRKRRETGGDGVTREVGADHEESISGQVVASAWCYDIQSQGGYRSLGVSSGGYLDNLYIITYVIHSLVWYPRQHRSIYLCVYYI